MIKNILYFFPAVSALAMYGTLAFISGFFAVEPVVWLMIVLLFMAAFSLSKQKFWGCFVGIAVGTIIILMSTQHTGQVFNEALVGAGLCIYYLVCGAIVCKNEFEHYQKMKSGN